MTDIKREPLDDSEISQFQLKRVNSGQIDKHYCIVCNSTSELHDKSITELKSEHSETSICDLIQRCLGASKLHRDLVDESSCHIRICQDCISKLNEYDLAYVTAECVANQLQQMLLETDLLYIEAAISTIDKIHTVDSPNDFCNINDDHEQDETNDYCVDKVEVIEPSTLRTRDHSDVAFSDAEKELDNEIPNLINNTKSKRIYECDSCKATFFLWKELRVCKAMNCIEIEDSAISLNLLFCRNTVRSIEMMRQSIAVTSAILIQKMPMPWPNIRRCTLAYHRCNVSCVKSNSDTNETFGHICDCM